MTGDRTNWRYRALVTSSVSLAIVMIAGKLLAQDADELAKAVQNPVANMISVPFALDFDRGTGPRENGRSTVLNIQPVVPFKLSQDWLLVVRTIVPVVNQDLPGIGRNFGTGDILQSFFFSPTGGSSGIIWGAGPVFSYPTASERALGSGRFSAGPTAVFLVQRGPWTVGGLANHLWSVAGNDRRQKVSATFLQPFVAYSLGGGWSVSTQAKISRDWINKKTVAALLAGPSKVFKIGNQAMSFGFQGRFYPVSPFGGPKWGVSATLSFLFPTK